MSESGQCSVGSGQRPEASSAIALRVNGLFFHKVSATGRVMTTWSLPGARLFGTWQIEEIDKVERRLLKKGHTVVREMVTVTGGAA